MRKLRGEVSRTPQPWAGRDPSGRRYRTLCKPREKLLRKPSLPHSGEGNTKLGTLADDRTRFRRGSGDGTSERVGLELEKPSGPEPKGVGAR